MTEMDRKTSEIVLITSLSIMILEASKQKGFHPNSFGDAQQKAISALHDMNTCIVDEIAEKIREGK